MWAVRRASLPLRNRGIYVRGSCVKLTPTTCVQDESPRTSYGQFLSRNKHSHSGHGSLNFTVNRRELSSQADNKKEDDLEDGFSELETAAAGDATENLLESDTELSDDGEEPHDESGLLDTEIDEPTLKKAKRGVVSEIFKAITSDITLPVGSVLDKCFEEGKELSRQNISLATTTLRNRKMYGKALQLSEWLESKKQLEFTERDYASRVDLVAKCRGLEKAEAYVETIPESFKGEIVYRSLLANAVMQNNVRKAEEIKSKMKSLGFPLTIFAINQLLLLYKRNDRKKIADVLLLMENENIKPSPFTYKVLIDSKGQYNDIAGMDQIVDTMVAEGIEPDVRTKAVMVRHYFSAGLQDKAETLLKEMEGENLEKNRWVCRLLLPLYAQMQKADEMARIWKICEKNPRIEECLIAIQAWGRLKKVDEAEAVFEIMSKKWKPSAKNYTLLLKVYADNKMLNKGKDLIKKMAESGCRIGPFTWDALVKLYVKAGEVEKADSVLQKACQQSTVKPLFPTYNTILEQYAKRGDIHNSEKIFYRMRQAGYAIRLKQYQLLIQAYINAKLPAYGIRDRMRADNVFPSKTMASQMAQVDGFRKTPYSDLLD